MPAAKLKGNANSWYGWLPDRPDHRDLSYQAVAPAPRRLPSRIDLREHCSPVEDQGALGSCTANALVGNLELLEKKAGHRPTNLSRLFVYYNERVIEGTVDSDSGAFLRDGIKALVKSGVCPESEWRYAIRKFSRKPPASCYKHAEQHCVVSYYRITKLQEMKSCLADGYPFVFGFTVYEAFESTKVAKTGQLDMPKPKERSVGGHAVMAVGYDDKEKRFLIRNSWGEDWGQDGYFTMPYAYLEDRNLSDDFWTIRAFKNQ
jgi:C1A family cysteine protease